MNIKEKFCELTKSTYPYGFEEQLIPFLPKGYKVDEDGNYYYEVGSGSKNIFACHLDTSCKFSEDVTHVFKGDLIYTDGKTILGADDKAGMTIMLYMIHKNVPGLYYFFIGEEVGCIGSTAAAKREDFFSKYQRMISFDRRGTGSIITHQSSRRTCSDKFADSLSAEFAKRGIIMERDSTGVYTDSAEFVKVIPECTNISVGYYKEHTNGEHQDIAFLEKLAKACVLIDWDSTAVERNPSKVEYKEYGGYAYYGGSVSYKRGNRTNDPWGDEYHDYFYNSNGYYRKSNKKRNRRDRTKLNDFYYGDHIDSKPDHYYMDGKKVYYNSLDNEITSDSDYQEFDRHKTDYYKGVKAMYLDDKITHHEWNVIKEQFLDMNDRYDRSFIHYMDEIT